MKNKIKICKISSLILATSVTTLGYAGAELLNNATLVDTGNSFTNTTNITTTDLSFPEESNALVKYKEKRPRVYLNQELVLKEKDELLTVNGVGFYSYLSNNIFTEVENEKERNKKLIASAPNEANSLTKYEYMGDLVVSKDKSVVIMALDESNSQNFKKVLEIPIALEKFEASIEVKDSNMSVEIKSYTENAVLDINGKLFRILLTFVFSETGCLESEKGNEEANEGPCVFISATVEQVLPVEGVSDSEVVSEPLKEETKEVKALEVPKEKKKSKNEIVEATNVEVKNDERKGKVIYMNLPGATVNIHERNRISEQKDSIVIKKSKASDKKVWKMN